MGLIKLLAVERSWCAIVLLTAVSLAGCGDPEPPPPPPGASTPVTSTSTVTSTVPSGSATAKPGAKLVRVISSPPGDRARARVFADYVRFWQRDMVALRDNDVRASGVLDYLFPPQLQRTLKYIADQRRAGVHTEGTISIRPRVRSVGQQSATIKDCLDQSASYDVDPAGRRIPLTQRRIPLVIALQFGMDNRWKVSNLTRDRGTC